MSDDQNNYNSNKPPKNNKTLIDLSIGLGLLVTFVILMQLLFSTNDVGITIIGAFILIIAGTFISVKAIRKNHPIIGACLLVVIAPSILLLLLAGACMVSFNGF